MFTDFIIVFFFFLLILVLGIVLYNLSFLFVQKTSDLEKKSIYECGFEPFLDTRGVFEVKFYLVAILFVIFDLEVTFLFPWILVLGLIGFFGFFFMFIFILVLGLVFCYEWRVGALDW
jgi:NADH:ubiquinone oxidoreductase subunit 3 (subunit A)